MTEQHIDTPTPAKKHKVPYPFKKRVARPVDVPRESYSVQEFIYMMGWSEGLFYKLLKAGKIASYKVGDKRFVSREEKDRIKREGVTLSSMAIGPAQSLHDPAKVTASKTRETFDTASAV